jgi:RNA polymerase sigma-70 factor (ECF subfamily)
MSSALLLLVTNDFLQLESSVQEQVYQDFYMLVYRMVMFIVRDHAAAEDIIQESFLRALGKTGQLAGADKLEPWLKKLTRNVTLNHLRKLKRNRAELDVHSQLAECEAAAASGHPARLENEVELKLMRAAIARYVAELRPSCRRILAMKLIDNMSYKEIADELDMSEGAVRQRLYRTRAAIRKQLAREWDFESEGRLERQFEQIADRDAKRNERETISSRKRDKHGSGF